MVSSPTLILFAIQSAIKLGRASRQAYVDSTLRREITLPLPNFDRTPNHQAMMEFYWNYEPRDETPPRLRTLIDILKNTRTLSDEQKSEMHVYYFETRLLAFSDQTGFGSMPDGSFLSDDLLRRLVTVRQWARDEDPTVSTLQRVGGTMIEIGVEYFANVPGGLNVNSRSGKALHAVFDALDDIRFAEDVLGDLPGKLAIAALESVSSSVALASEDPNVQKLIRITARGLATDVAKRLQEIQSAYDAGSGGSVLDAAQEKERVSAWADLVFRSVLNSAGNEVSKSPDIYLGVKQGAESSFFTDISTAILGIIVDAPAGELDQVFTKESLERIVRSTMGAVRKHPELLTGGDQSGLSLLIGQIAGELAQLDNIVTRSVFPEILRLVIEKSGQNLDLLWPDGEIHPARRVLMVASKEILTRLSKKPVGGEWSVEFGADDIIAVADVALEEVASNPRWIVDKAGNQNQTLGVAVGAMLEALRRRGDERLSSETASRMIQSGLRAVALRLEFLDELPNQKKIIGAVFDAIVTAILNAEAESKAAWRLAKAEMLTGITAVALEKLVETKFDAIVVQKLETVMTVQIGQINEGQPWTLRTFGEALERALMDE